MDYIELVEILKQLAESYTSEDKINALIKVLYPIFVADICYRLNRYHQN
jgi:hypothetical protein